MIYKRHGYSGKRSTSIKVGIGLEELRQLLDFEISNTRFIENSEQHQAIWCILRQTAVRPGAMGRLRITRGATFLSWEDIKFHTVQGQPGKFICVLSFENLKTNREDPEYTMHTGGKRTLVCYLDSPSPENIIFSVPHRLLAIALRRELIEGITTVKELITSELHNITVGS